ncbi:MAG: 3'-5' exonuclease [Bacteroidetes bacterium]|nr:3'-5' exonuclease [Bacteroidota bacterium]
MSPYPLANILFLDIETVPQYASFADVPDAWKELWNHKASYLIKDKLTETSENIYNRAGIYAEFGKIICISCGVISGTGKEKKLLLKSFYGDDEKMVLQQFSGMLLKWENGPAKYLCAHNGKEFDFPYLCRRFIINEMPIPAILQLSGKKPWEITHIDTLELWKFGDYKSYTSLNLLAHALNIPTPKDDIDGSKVCEVYWQERQMQRIVTYCQKDVVTVAQVFLKLSGEPVIKEENMDIK